VNDSPTHTVTVRSALHLGPVVTEQAAVAWNPTIERITVQLGPDASLHLRPNDAIRLARALVAAAHDAEPTAPGAFPDWLLDADTDGGGDER